MHREIAERAALAPTKNFAAERVDIKKSGEKTE
jgi:hypothetical protein